MRAKNEFKLIAEAYDTKLLLERIVDGKLMCPEACCGAPVVECTCGPDCPHCNCFMIHKAMKSKGFTNKLLKEFYKMRDPDGDGSWPDDDDDRDHPDYGEPEYGDRGTGEIGGEDNEEKQKGVDGKACWKGYRREGTKKKGGKTVDNCVKVEDEEVLREYGIADGMMAAEKGAEKIVKKLGIDDEEGRELPVGHYEHMVRLTKNYPDDDPWSQGSVQVRKTDKEVIQKFLDKGYRIVKPEDNEEIEYENPATRRKEAQRAANERAHKKWQDPEYWKEFGVKGLGPTKDEDAEDHPKQGITGYQHTDAMAQAAAQRALGKIKPYVSTFVGDGGQKLHVVMSNKERPHPDQPPETMYSYDDAKDWWRANYERLRDE